MSFLKNIPTKSKLFYQKYRLKGRRVWLRTSNSNGRGGRIFWNSY